MTLAIILNAVFALLIVGGLVALLGWAIHTEHQQRQTRPGLERRRVRAAYARAPRSPRPAHPSYRPLARRRFEPSAG
ncbi:MAG TPA: hypothetical protein VFN55_12870 [Solirubrobacteraceae bacterium]|nr:hypothetical protein [Solirubrobacteraceae bacterium]